MVCFPLHIKVERSCLRYVKIAEDKFPLLNQTFDSIGMPGRCMFCRKAFVISVGAKQNNKIRSKFTF